MEGKKTGNNPAIGKEIKPWQSMRRETMHKLLLLWDKDTSDCLCNPGGEEIYVCVSMAIFFCPFDEKVGEREGWTVIPGMRKWVNGTTVSVIRIARMRKKKKEWFDQ